MPQSREKELLSDSVSVLSVVQLAYRKRISHWISTSDVKYLCPTSISLSLKGFIYPVSMISVSSSCSGCSPKLMATCMLLPVPHFEFIACIPTLCNMKKHFHI